MGEAEYVFNQANKRSDLKQIALFKDKQVDNLFEKKVTSDYKLEELDIGDITFLSGQEEPIHRWYRLTPSYSPELVRYFLKEFNVKPHKNLILDPFCGRGTTLIECQKHGVNAVGFEINPLFHLVVKHSLMWKKKDLKLLNLFLDECCKEFEKSKKLDIDESISKYNVRLPDIHDVFRWWKPAVLKDLLIAKHIALGDKYRRVYEYLWLAINSSCLDCANIHRNHPTITFDDDHTRDISVLNDLSENIRHIIEDVASLTDAQLKYSCLNEIKLRNSCLQFDDYGKTIDAVITSPPYPNRFSYVHQTRPQLHFMEVVKERIAATEIDLETIGGTWGRATSNLMKELIVPDKTILKHLCYFNELKDKSLLMCNYATKYFLDLNEHIKHLRKNVKKQFIGAYVVGNSRLSGVEIYTETILAKLFEINGFNIDKIMVFRKRGGRKKLYETAVVVKT